MNIYIIFDKVANTATECFVDMNLACAVRNLRATVETDKISRQLNRISRWDDSILYEIVFDGKDVKVTNKYDLHDVTKLPKEEEKKDEANSK